MDQGCDLPIVDGEPFYRIAEPKLALRNHNDVFDVAIIEAARTVIHSGVAGILNGCAGDIALVVLYVKTLRPGPVSQQAEGGGKTMIDGGDKAIVVGHAFIADKDRTTSTGRVKQALRRIREHELGTRNIVAAGGRGARASGRTGRCNPAAAASPAPHSRDELNRVERQT